MKIIGHDKALFFLGTARQKNRLHSSLFFLGPSGVGKKRVALKLSRALFCDQQSTTKLEPLYSCGACDNCHKVDSRSHPDLMLVNRENQAQWLDEKVEAQTAIKIESVRMIEKFFSLKSSEARSRVAIIDEAQTLTIEAANSLLKLLEEPPSGATIILISSSRQGLPPTIISRCALIRFTALASKDIAQYLHSEEKMDVDEAFQLAEKAHGSIGKALELKEEIEKHLDPNQISIPEIIEFISTAGFRRDGKRTTSEILKTLLEAPSVNSYRRITLLRAENALQHHVTPRLVLLSTLLDLRGN